MSMCYRSVAELESYLPTLDAAPRDQGTVSLVVSRPTPGERKVLDDGELHVAVGLVGDSWSRRPSSRTPDKSPHPDMQINVINATLAAFIAFDDVDRQALAGDQLHVDLELSHDNLPPGTELRIGRPEQDRGAVIMVTDQPHTGCAKFIERYGADAMKFVNGRLGRPRRLRGLNARVVVPGVVRPGDPILVVRPS
ncbi:MAG: hypothetical protein V9G15_04425 [Dermatophilaceae bacterium]